MQKKRKLYMEKNPRRMRDEGFSVLYHLDPQILVHRYGDGQC